MALAQIGADGRPDIGRITAEVANHGLHGFRADLPGGTPPAGMGSAHGAGNGIMEQNRGAVGGEYHQGHPGVVCYQGIALGIIPVEAPIAVRPSHRTDDVRMGLPGQHQVVGGKPKGFPQNFDVPADVFFCFPFLDGDAQRIKDSGADTVEAGGEAMGHHNALGSQIF